MKKTTQFEKIIRERIKLGKPKIGFGLKEPNKEVLKSLVKSKKYAEIILVGPKAINSVKGFQKIISELGKTKFPVEVFDNMKAAIKFAAANAQKGDIILLSPGAASFGVFKNEFDRGEQFNKAVKRI